MWRRLVTSEVSGLVQLVAIASKRRATPPDTDAPSPPQAGPFRSRASEAAARQIDQRAEAAVKSPASHGEASADARQHSAAGPSPPPRVTAPSAKVRIFDKFGMKADPAKVDISGSVDDLIQLLPENLHSPARNHFAKFGITKLLETQRVTIPLVLEGRDVLCIAPPASGKTLTYLIPSLMQILSLNPPRGEHGGDDTIHRETADRIARGELCKYCEMDVFQNPLCSFTGHPHRIPLDKDTIFERKATRFRELTSVTEPLLVIVVPTAQLAVQIRDTAVSLSFGLRIAALHRTNSPDESRQMLKWFGGCQVLISTPEPIIAALLKGKLSFRKTQVVVMDEVDVLLSTTFFEQIKILLGALPKHVARPQRLLFGATLPRPMHEMIRSTMLLPSHRFVRAVHVPGEAPQHHAVSARDDEVASSSSSSRVTHVVLMLSRVEKLDRLVRMFADGDLSGSQRTLIFCASRTNVQYVSEQLTSRLRSTPAASAARVGAISSAMTQTARDAVIRMFQSGVISVLVSTDLLSRGIDFHKVVSVVHYDMPLDMNTWVHRNGRCGRHGDPGWVWSLFQPENVKLAKPLAAYLRQHGQLVPPKLKDYAKQNFLDIFKSSTFHHPTKGYNQGRNPERHTPVLGRGLPSIPDFRQRSHNRNFRSK